MAFMFMGTCPLKIVSILILKLIFRQYQNIKIYKKDLQVYSFHIQYKHNSS